MSAVTGHDVLTLGESLALLTVEKTGGLRRGSELQLSFGGAESNVAIGVARLGGKAAWSGRLGDDAIGELILRELRAERVVTYEVRDPEVPTALMLKERPFSGRSRVSYYRRGQAGSRLAPNDLAAHAIAASRVLHVTGITAGLGAEPLQALHTAIDTASKSGRTVSFDVNHRASMWGSTAEASAAYIGLAQRADLIFAGEDEAELLVGTSDPAEAIDALFALGNASTVVVKLGAAGAMAATRSGDRISLPAVPVEVVDTVGAGDAFVAGWLSEHVRGATASECLATAVACGAFACTATGDWESLPTRAELGWLTTTSGDPVIR